MPDIDLMGAVYPDVPSVLLPTNGGGTALFTDVSATTATDADVASGKIYFKSDGTQSTGNASGGGGSSLVATGTVSGTGSTTIQIPCGFEPDEVYVYGDLTGDPSLRGIASVTILKDNVLYVTAVASSSSTTESLNYAGHGITDYNESDTASPHATYSGGILTIDSVVSATANRFTSGITYSYSCVRYAELTEWEGGSY